MMNRIMSDGADARKPVSLAFIAVYILAQFGIWVALLTPVIMTIALRVGAIATEAEKGRWLGWILAVGAFVALIATPICGALSDLTRSRFGRRRPWLLGGLVVSGAGLALLGTAPNLLVLGLGWVICQAGFNAMQAGCLPILPDVVPVRWQGRVAGMLGMTSTAATFTGSWITQYTQSSDMLMFMAPFGITVIGIVTLCLILPDRPAALDAERSVGLAAMIRSIGAPFRDWDFSWAFGSRFLIMMAWSFLLTYQLFFLTDQLFLPKLAATQVMVKSMAIIAVATIAVSVVGGFITDWTGRRKPLIFLAAILEGAGFLTIAFAPSVNQFLGGVAIAGIGKGLYFAVDLALLAAILPSDKDRAKDMGVFQIANSLPQSLAPAIAPVILMLGSSTGKDYTAIYVTGAVFALLGALTIKPVRRSK
ncbi:MULTISPECIES: MFS transporter [unclassified Sphingobium]|uniref:MFS transporter n=1 Tax=unclassified Sphingobium TaxID=2611147 RepID=UPI000D156C5E|nr:MULTISPECIES: MFS transporter [unclassified Sphingobium]MBG6117390.1 MFS family permease [Sphingobium sp. JAI105]PSO09604.1 MFS transporter [Sphingobium sp. AEW4]TWC96691.1 MFS transporter [Sphingobium sp. AEW010]TWD16445.1 MFS transporter [Sphingobium sp. AEW013]TWD19769.1 MFS transporter [Sphingobium sp. AEW001]